MKHNSAAPNRPPPHPEHLRRKRVKRRMDWVPPGISVIGAILASAYYTITARSGLQEVAANPQLLVVSQVLVPILVILGIVIGSAAERPLWRWYLDPDIENQLPPSQQVQRLALNAPLNSARVAFSMWTLSGLTFAYFLFQSMPQGYIYAFGPRADLSHSSSVTNAQPVSSMGL